MVDASVELDATADRLPRDDPDALKARLDLVDSTLRDAWLHGDTVKVMTQHFVESTGISVTERTLFRYFKLLGYKRRNAVADPDDRARITAAVALVCASRGAGYRAVQSEMQFKYGPQFRASRHFIAALRRTTDPESTRRRYMNRMIRRVYSGNGPGAHHAYGFSCGVFHVNVYVKFYYSFKLPLVLIPSPCP